MNKRTLMILGFVVVTAACGRALDDEDAPEAPERVVDMSASMPAPPSVMPDEPQERGSMEDGPPDEEEVLVPDLTPAPGDACVFGARRACTCKTQVEELAGEQVCVDPEAGTYSECGCAYTPPYDGPTCQLGQLECGNLLESDGSLAGGHCCTLRGECGLGNFTVFGLECVPRDAEPIGKLSEECGPTFIPFIEVEDCCRPDDTCGLKLLTGENWTELGCMKRETLAQKLKRSYLLGIFLLINGTPDLLDEVEPASCDYDAR